MSWIVQPFRHEEIDLGFSYIAAITLKTASHGSRDVTIGATGASIPRRRVAVGAPISAWGAQWLRGRRKIATMSQVLSSIHRTYASKRPQFWIRGRQTCFLPKRHLTSLRPCTGHVTIKLMQVNLPAHEVRTTPSMNKKVIISFTAL